MAGFVDARGMARPSGMDVARRQADGRGLQPQAARAEAARCLFCFDAPCVTACPTGIDVPGFIRGIASGNLDGSARTILAANPLGGTCARVCPVERLCEGACVRGSLDRPIAIGLLQRFAIDAYLEAGRPFVVAGEPRAGRVAVVGSGPAGLACAAELRRLGVAVTIFEAREQAGGLCAYGIVPWRHARELTAHEVAEIERPAPRSGAGLASARTCPRRRSWPSTTPSSWPRPGTEPSVGIPGEGLDGVFDALAVLEPVVTGEGGRPALGPRVGVIGAGSTAMDAAAAAVRHGARDGHRLLPGSEAEAPAHPHSIELARALGVSAALARRPGRDHRTDVRVSGAVFDVMRLELPIAAAVPRPIESPARASPWSWTRSSPRREEAVPRLVDDFAVGMRGGRVAVEPATGRTDNPRVWAGGDLVNGGREVVHAVQEGKLAARSIAAFLGARRGARISAATPSPAPEPAPGVSLAVEMAGIRSPNPFWLASGPPANTGEMVTRAFEAGWGGAVWKTVGDPITNVSARLGSLDIDGRRMVGISNIELISDRPIETNLAEVREVKRRFPDRAVVVSLMVESKRDAWHDIVRRVNDTGADGIELNFGCPHGMAERGMGAASARCPSTCG